MADYKEIIRRFEPEMEKTMSFLSGEMQKIRTSRVSPALVEDVEVECFGKTFPLKQLAAISASEARVIIIQPWDRSYIEYIEKAILQSGISGSPIVDQDVIRLSFPPLSEDLRKDLVRKTMQIAELARQTIRKWRQEAWDEVQTKFQAGEVREDDKYKAKDELQKLIDKYNEKIEDIVQKKNKELME